MSTIYSPGLVSKKDECASFIRSSADGVSILFSHDHSEVVPIPIEIKSRKSVRTFRIRISNWQLRFEDDAEVVLHDVCERNVLFTQFPAQKGSRCHLLFKHCIPDAHERIQLLHHACIYQSKRAFFVVAKDKDVMAIYRVKFGQQLIQSYINACRNIFRSKLEWLYTPRESFPAIPESWRTAIKDKALKGYKLDLGSLKSILLLWWAINSS